MTTAPEIQDADAASQGRLKEMINTALRLIDKHLDSSSPLCNVNLSAKYESLQINLHVEFEAADPLNPQTTISAREAFDDMNKPMLRHTYIHAAGGYRFPATEYSGYRHGWRLTIHGRGGFVKQDELRNWVFSDTPHVPKAPADGDYGT